MSITEKELAEQLAIAASNSEPWSAVARRAAELLGVELADPQPEPGVYLDIAGRLVIVDAENAAWDFSSGFRPLIRENDAALKDLTPARVVPAEPAELTEVEAEEIFNRGKEDAGHLARWSNYASEAREHFLLIMNAAIKYWHGAS